MKLHHIDILYKINDEDIISMYDCIKRSRRTLYSCQQVDLSKSKAVIKKAYINLELPNPKIVLQNGFNAAKDWIKRHYFQQLSCEDYQQLYMPFNNYLFNEDSSENSFRQLKNINLLFEEEAKISHNIYRSAYQVLDDVTDYWVSRVIGIEIGHINNAFNQYWIEIIHKKHDNKAWNILKNLIQECPFLIPLSEVCIVIDRPVSVHLNNELLPHAQNQAAIRFADDLAIYCYHGIPFPVEYGEVPINDWKPEWIESEYIDGYKSILMYNIGYQRFSQEYPDYDFWQEYDRLLSESVDIIINWQLYHYNQLYLKQLQTDELKINPDDAVKIIDSLPFKLPTESWSLYQYYNGGYQLTPGLYFYPLKQAIQALSNLNWIKSDTGYPFPLFKGTRDEIYYVLADDPEPTYSHVYCIFSGEEPMVYAECVTSLIVTIAQCYQEGAYYIAIDEETGERTIEQNLDKIEPIFEKFNPDQIDNWRKIWKGDREL
jgi:hypothetical protein